jgi:hypothetical protein
MMSWNQWMVRENVSVVLTMVSVWLVSVLQRKGRRLVMFALMFETQEEVNEAIERLSADKPFIVNMQYVPDDFRQYC